MPALKLSPASSAWREATKPASSKLPSIFGKSRHHQAGAQRGPSQGKCAQVETPLDYFANNVARMQYGTFRAKKYFIGSGVIEAGCLTVIGKHCKQSGMFWGESGAEKVLAFRCIHASRRLDSFWKYRLNMRATPSNGAVFRSRKLRSEIGQGGIQHFEEEICIRP